MIEGPTVNDPESQMLREASQVRRIIEARRVEQDARRKRRRAWRRAGLLGAASAALVFFGACVVLAAG